MSAEFIITLGDPDAIPSIFNGIFLKGHRERRIAMVGRSNVGKSSLINALVESRVAQVSSEPGKTRNIHFYLWKEAKRIIADLPGYGYAKAGHEERNRWAAMIDGYLKSDENLEKALVLLDARHGPTDKDREAIRFLAGENIPIEFVFTKADALKNQAEKSARTKEVVQAMKELGYHLEKPLWVSSKTKDGLKALTKLICGGE